MMPLFMLSRRSLYKDNCDIINQTEYMQFCNNIYGYRCGRKGCDCMGRKN